VVEIIVATKRVLSASTLDAHNRTTTEVLVMALREMPAPRVVLGDLRPSEIDLLNRKVRWVIAMHVVALEKGCTVEQVEQLLARKAGL